MILKTEKNLFIFDTSNPISHLLYKKKITVFLCTQNDYQDIRH
uniref:Uncharacterized protein n=1 Tax=uncultured delta proteobacterium HF0130_19C20 TaxID=710828 RepID=E0XT67_9DELT|nr:hypothetical protein [uncultured delta proteobacterium HF0130_19C20]